MLDNQMINHITDPL